MRCFNRAIVVVLLVANVVSPAQTRREDEPNCDEKSAKKMEITGSDATILDLVIGRASLKDVQAKLGNANVTRVSRDEESDISVCYVSPIDGTVLVFYSGAMGGWKDITWFALWSREATFPHASLCTPSTLVSQGLRTPSGVRLGLTKADLERILGKPTERGTKSVKYSYPCRKKMTDEEITPFQDHGLGRQERPLF
jgi:hypothetical protein